MRFVIMKKRLGMMLLCAGVLFSTAACDVFDPGKDVNIVYSDGSTETVHYKKGKFEYTPLERSGYYFMGCYAEQSMKSTKYVNHEAKRLFEDIDLPETIYAMYVKADGAQIIDFEFDDKSTSSSIEYGFGLDEAYKYYFGKKDYVGYLNIKFKHYEKESGVVGVSTFHWASYSLKTSSNTVESGTLRSNGGYSSFNRMYKVDSDLIFNGLSFNVSRPSACASSEATQITSFKATLYFGEAKDISGYKYSNLFSESSQSYFSTSFEDNSATINGSYSVNASMKYTFPFNLKDWIAESQSDYITFEMSISHYGRKLLLFSNWINGTFSLSSGYSTSVHLESNDDFKTSTFSIRVPKEDAVNISQATVSLTHPSNNASSMFYYVRSTSLKITRS